MPHQVGALIKTDKGIRRLAKEEVARGLGIPKGSESHLSPASLGRTTSVFHWEYLSTSLQQYHEVNGNGYEVTRDLNSRKDVEVEQRTPTSPITLPEFSWTPPDLEPGKEWHQIRLANLWTASRYYQEADAVYQDGLNRLEIHQNNYSSEGPNPKQLQLLWWEFPIDHWETLRLGARQNFIHSPEAQLRPNAPMDNEMTIAAADFVDELFELGVLRGIDEGNEVLTNAPLFVVPKEGQEGQRRVIADML